MHVEGNSEHPQPNHTNSLEYISSLPLPMSTWKVYGHPNNTHTSSLHTQILPILSNWCLLLWVFLANTCYRLCLRVRLNLSAMGLPPLRSVKIVVPRISDIHRKTNFSKSIVSVAQIHWMLFLLQVSNCLQCAQCVFQTDLSIRTPALRACFQYPRNLSTYLSSENFAEHFAFQQVRTPRSTNVEFRFLLQGF